MYGQKNIKLDCKCSRMGCWGIRTGLRRRKQEKPVKTA